jgi:chromate transporter
MKRLIEIFYVFLKIGAFTFGGGFAMIPLIEKEIVENKDWVKKEEFIDVIALAQTLPGPIAVNTSVLVGHKMNGLLGAVFATLGSALPSFLIIATIAAFFTRFNEYKIVQDIFAGIRPAVVALLVMAVISIGKGISRSKKNIIVISIFALLLILGLSPILAIISGAIIGMIPLRKVKGAEKSGVSKVGGKSVDS